MALNEAGASAEGAALPFALDRVEIFGPCVPEMAVHIRTSGKGEQTGRVRTLDLDLMDMDGVVRVRMQGFATRKLAKPAQEPTKGLADDAFLFAPEWRPIAGLSERQSGAVRATAMYFSAIIRRLSPNSFRSSGLSGRATSPKAKSSLPMLASPTHTRALLALIQQAAREAGPGPGSSCDPERRRSARGPHRPSSRSPAGSAAS